MPRWIGLLVVLTLAAASLVAVRNPSHAAPEGGTIVAGDATIAQNGAGTMINQLTDKAIINWQGFGIDINELVKFMQPSEKSAALNRVTGTTPSNILGQLIANGRVFLLNPNGILFGKDATIDVGSLAATTFGIKDSDFLSGKYEFLQNPELDPSYIINKGEIKIADNGFAFLVAPSVDNSGLVLAKVGKVVLGSGDKFTLDFHGDDLTATKSQAKSWRVSRGLTERL